MKKVLGLVLALALVLSLAAAASAVDLTIPEIKVGSIEEVQTDLQQVFSDLTASFGVDAVKSAVQGALSDLSIPAGTAVDAADLPANAGAVAAAGIIDRLGLEGTGVADTLTAGMSNDFVSFLAGLYIDVPPVVVTPTTVPATPTTQPPLGPEEPPIKTGASPAIAIAAFAALSLAAAGAFVCLKKKED